MNYLMTEYTNNIKKRAAQVADSLLSEGYRLMYETDLEDYHYMYLRHSSNGNRMNIMYQSDVIFLQKNGHVVKKIYAKV